MFHIPLGKRGLHLGLLPAECAKKHPDTPLWLDHDMDCAPEAGRELTTARLAALIEDFAGRLWAAGVRPGTHVAVYKRHNFDIYLLAVAASRIGAVPAMLSPALTGETVAALLGRLRSPYLLTDAGKLENELAGQDVHALTAGVLIAGEGPAEDAATVSLRTLAGAPVPRFSAPDLDSAALMTHTSGTTGIPKLVVHTPRSLAGRLRPQALLAKLVRDPGPYALHVSFVHSRMFMAMALALPKGMPTIVMADGDPELVAELFAKHRPGVVETHPNSYVEWEALAEHPLHPLQNVKLFSGTFDAIHPGTIDTLLSGTRRENARFFQIYGQSECGPLTGRWYNPRNAAGADGRCLGHPMPGLTHIRVVPRNGRRPGRKTPGFIEASADGRAVNYFGEEARYQAEETGRWWRTGDVGFRTRRGCVHVLDRAVDVIENVDSTLEIEDSVMGQLHELIEVVVIPGPRQEPLPVVCTKLNAPLDLDRWRRAVARFPQLADPVQMPLDDLPRTATMKVQRIELARRLRERYEATGSLVGVGGHER
ncbi:MAG TPA: class I adenylate-forming enzyme family protein [Actinospica sp.]|nr:class I adenylate-forming enzyme family protein [Actinospica sp.]